MGQKIETKPKKGFIAILKESLTKISQGCGPGCGCHVEEKHEADKDNKTASQGHSK